MWLGFMFNCANCTMKFSSSCVLLCTGLWKCPLRFGLHSGIPTCLPTFLASDKRRLLLEIVGWWGPTMTMSQSKPRRCAVFDPGIELSGGRLKDYLLMCGPAPKSAVFFCLLERTIICQEPKQPSRLSPPLWWHHNFSANSELWP